MYSLPVFEHQLVMYVTAAKETFSKPFDLSTVPIVTREQADAEDRKMKLTTTTPTLKAPNTGPKKESSTSGTETNLSGASANQKHAQQLLLIPELKAHGALLKSSPAVELTESETEYIVSVVKHIFNEHIVLQFDIQNTLPGTILEKVSILSTPSEEDGESALEEEFIIPASKLASDESGTVYVSFKRKQGDKSFPVTSFTNALKFTSKEIDPSSGEAEDDGYEDDYEIEGLELNGSDYVIPTFAGSFNHVWEQVGAAGEEAVETLQLSNVKSIAGTSMSHPFLVHIPICLHRCRGTTGQGFESSAARRFRHSGQQQYAYAQAVW